MSNRAARIGGGGVLCSILGIDAVIEEGTHTCQKPS